MLLLLSLATPALGLAQQVHPALWPQGRPGLLLDPDREARITALLARMSPEEKVGQTIQADISTVTPEDLDRYPLGSVLAGGGSGPGGDDLAPAPAWLDLADRFYRASMRPRPGRLQIPIMFGIDAVHGHNNIVGATLFPHNIGLGAAHDDDLVRRIGAVTAAEVAVTGIDWTFAPTVAQAQDLRWGRSYESYSDDPALVARYATAMIDGLQGELASKSFEDDAHVVATLKHFLGDGGTWHGRDQGDTPCSEADLIRLHASGYGAAVAAGALTVMASYSSWQGTKMHANHDLLTDVLKGRLGFNGFVIGDWNGHGQVPGCNDAACPLAFNAGIDMFMAPDRWKALFESQLLALRQGTISEARLDDAVRRILRVKLLAGLFDKGPPAQRRLAGRFDMLGNPAHRALAREAAGKSLVLLKNDAALLPLSPRQTVLVAGSGADNIAKQAGGWTLSWQGGNKSPDNFPGATSIFAGIRRLVEAAGGHAQLSEDGSFTARPDVAIAVFGEDPYAEFSGDRSSLDYQPPPRRDLQLLRRLADQGIATVAVFLSGRPLWVNPELNAAGAFVVAWLPGSEGEAIADHLFVPADGKTARDFTGRLPFAWPATALAQDGPALFPRGYGLSLADRASLPSLSEESGVTAVAAGRAPIVMAGALIAPWSAQLGDDTGSLRATLPHQLSGSGTVALDMEAKQGTPGEMRVTWQGGTGEFSLFGPNRAWRQAIAGEPVLQLTYRVVIPPSAPVRWGQTDMTARMRAPAAAAWQTTRFRLSCLVPQWQATEQPLLLASAGSFSLAIRDAELVADRGDAVCG